MVHDEVIPILDFGSQYAQLIARRVRELNVYSELLPHYTTMAELERRGVKAVILSGGPASVYDDGAPKADPAIWSGRRLRPSFAGAWPAGAAVSLIGWSLGGVIGPIIISTLLGEDDNYTLGYTTMGIIALVSVAIIAGAVYVSKRRPVAIGEEVPESVNA